MEQVAKIRRVFAREPRVLFAYLYGSFLDRPKEARDIDIAIHPFEGANPYSLSADLKVALHRETGLPPDRFDVQFIEGLPKRGDLFALLYLKNVLGNALLLVDRDPGFRTDFLECFAMKYRECEGLFDEVLA